MSILDTFYILFEGKTAALQAELNKGSAAGQAMAQNIAAAHEAGTAGAAGHAAMTEKVVAAEGKLGMAGQMAGAQVGIAMTEAGEHVGILGAGLESARERMVAFGESAVEQIATLIGAFAALFAIEETVAHVFEQATQTQELGASAKSLNVSVEELDMWGQAVKRIGGTVEAFRGSLMTMNAQLARIAVTGKSRSLKIFENLGIDVKHATNALELLPQLVTKIEGMDKAKSGGLLRAIGLDPKTIELVQSGSLAVEAALKRVKSLGLTTEEDVEKAEKYKLAWADIQQLMRGLVIDFDDLILPALTAFIDAISEITQYLEDHKDFVVGFFIAITAAVLWLTDAFGLLSVATFAALWPEIALIALVLALSTAFAIVYDDVMNFLAGNKSVIGELNARWPTVGIVVRAVAEAFTFLWDTIKTGANDIGTWISKLPEGMRQWKTAFAEAGVNAEAMSERIRTAIGTLSPQMQAGINAVMEQIAAFFRLLGDTSILTLRVIGESGISIFKELGAVIRLIGDFFVDPMHALDTFGARTKTVIGEIIAEFPGLKTAFEDVGKAFDVVGKAIIKIWDMIKAAIADTIGVLQSAVSGIMAAPGAIWGGIKAAPGALGMAIMHPGQFLGIDPVPGAAAAPKPPPAPATLPGIPAGQAELGAIGQAAPMLMPGQAANNNEVKKEVSNISNTTVNIGTITTAATDGAALAAELKTKLQDEYNNTAQTAFANGVSH